MLLLRVRLYSQHLSSQVVLMRAFVWHLFGWRRYPRWRRHLREARRVCVSRASEFNAWQERKVAAHLAWAHDTIPWHRAHGGRALRDFPVLTRRDVQDGIE